MLSRGLRLLLLLAGLCSCEPAKVYEKHYVIERITWNRFDVKTFEIEIENISKAYDFYVAIRHHTEIPLDHLDIMFILYTPSGEERIMDQRIRLRDNEGKLLGDGMGDLWDVLHLARSGFEFREKGICRVEISSRMSKIDLPGILQVGLIVKESKN